MARAAEGSKLALKLLHLRPHNELTMGEHARDCIVERAAEPLALSVHVDEGNGLEASVLVHY